MAWIAPSINTRCNCCSLGCKENPIHIFFSYLWAQEIWNFIISLGLHLNPMRIFILVNGIYASLGLCFPDGFMIPVPFGLSFVALHSSLCRFSVIARYSHVANSPWISLIILCGMHFSIPVVWCN